MSEWQPIETAPKDGTIVLVATDTPVGIGMYFWGMDYFKNPCWLEMGRGVVRDDRPLPTHWMPLPLHPKGEE